MLRLDPASAFANNDQRPEMAMRGASQVAGSIGPTALWIAEIEKSFAASAAERLSLPIGTYA